MVSEPEISRLIVRQHIHRLNQEIVAEEERLNSIQTGLKLSKEKYDTAKRIMDKAILKAEKFREKESAMTCSEKKPEHASLRIENEAKAKQNHVEALRKYNAYQEAYKECNTVLENLKRELDKSKKLDSNLSLSWFDSSALDPLSNEELEKAKEACLNTQFSIYKPA